MWWLKRSIPAEFPSDFVGGWLVACLGGWAAGHLAGWLAGWLVGWLRGQLACWLDDWLAVNSGADSALNLEPFPFARQADPVLLEQIFV